jgi:hypothetical protein
MSPMYRYARGKNQFVWSVLEDYMLISDLNKFKIYCLGITCVVSLHFASSSMSTTHAAIIVISQCVFVLK